MGDVVLKGATSGQITLTPTAVAGTSVLTLPATTDTVVCKATTDTLTNKTLTSPTITGAVMSSMASSVITSETAKAYNWNGLTNNTVLDFTGIPSWVKRITVMFTGVSTNGTSVIIIQIGDSGGVEISGYAGVTFSALNEAASSTAGWSTFRSSAATSVYSGISVISLIDSSSNTWVIGGTIGNTTNSQQGVFSGTKSLSATLDRVRITTVNGTDTFDAGSVNILYE